MAKRVVILFYKRLVTLGGAEVLLSEHYVWLKSNGYAPKVLCFEISDLDRINIDPADVVIIEGGSLLAQTNGLRQLLTSLKPHQVFCHSGYIEFGVAARLARVSYSVFVHQPTTMSFNESDKFAARFIGKYKKFARKDGMYQQLCSIYDKMPLKRRVFVNLRSYLSQWVLRGADNLFVLSDYAVQEKREIFGLKARYLSGALPENRIVDLMNKGPVRPIAEPITLVSVSRIDENKRIDILIDAVALLRRNGRNVRLVLGGSGPASEMLKLQVRKLDLDDYVTFLGYVPEKDIPDLYASMDLFVTIDWADFRITTYEVLSENRRVIVSDDTEADEVLLQSGYLYVAAANVEDLSDVILKALDSPVAWTQKQLASYLSDHTWPAYFSKIDQAALGNA